MLGIRMLRNKFEKASSVAGFRWQICEAFSRRSRLRTEWTLLIEIWEPILYWKRSDWASFLCIPIERSRFPSNSEFMSRSLSSLTLTASLYLVRYRRCCCNYTTCCSSYRPDTYIRAPTSYVPCCRQYE